MDYEQRLEAAARKLCSLRGIDPMERVTDPTNRTMAYVTTYYWRVVALELEKAIERVKIGQLLTEYDLI